MAGLSIIVPVYNEENALDKTLKIFKMLRENKQDLEFIFIDDGSTDNSLDILKKYVGNGIKLLIHDRNKGYGASIKAGINVASYDYIAITDADGSYPNEIILDLFELFIHENADMLIGERSGEFVEMTFLRKIPKYFLTKLAEFLTDCKIPDLNSGLRVIRKDLVLKFMRYLPDRFSFTSTLTLLFLSNNYKILYFPINYYKRTGKSKIKPVKDTLNFFQLIIRTVMFFNPLKVFLPLSLFFCSLSFCVLIISYFKGKVMDITTILLFVTGLHFLALGLLADLIDKRLSK